MSTTLTIGRIYYDVVCLNCYGIMATELSLEEKDARYGDRDQEFFFCPECEEHSPILIVQKAEVKVDGESDLKEIRYPTPELTEVKDFQVSGSFILAREEEAI